MFILEKKLSKFGSIPGLSRIKKLLSKWNNPQNNLKIILVGGTNGKGSTVSYLSSILKESGYKVGSFYSPHLVNYNERIKINGKEIKNKTLNSYAKKILKYRGKITIFEAITAIAFQYFSDKKCDYAVMEIGMGGRLDACNIADETLSIITNISYDHTQYLGKNLRKIAYEKAGIMKKGTAITGAKGESLEEIKRISKKRKIKLKILGKDFKLSNIIANNKETKFKYNKTNYEVNLLGEFQAFNASLAIKTAEELGLSKNAIKLGLQKAKINGRMQIIGKKPLVIIDSAHNPNAITQIVTNLQLFNYRKLIVVFGVMKDKNWKKMLKIIKRKSNLIIYNKPKYSRAEDPKNLNKFFKGKIISDVNNSLKYARKVSREDDLVLVVGSIYQLSELKIKK